MKWIITYLAIGFAFAKVTVIDEMRRERAQLKANEEERRTLMDNGDYAALRLAQQAHQFEEDNMGVTRLKDAEEQSSETRVMIYAVLSVMFAWFFILVYVVWTKNKKK